MINMITSSWMPFAVVWLIVLIQDTPVARTALKGALEMAALGPFALMWVGYMAFLMSAQASDVLANNIFFAVAYPCINIGLIIMHWLMSPGIYAWIDRGEKLTGPPAEEEEVAEDGLDVEDPEDAEDFEDDSADPVERRRW